MDSSESPVHGEQEGSTYNGHFESVCYHPLFLFNSHGECLAAKLPRGYLTDSELDLLIHFKLEGTASNGEVLSTLNGNSSSNAARQKLKRLLAKLRRLARKATWETHYLCLEMRTNRGRFSGILGILRVSKTYVI